MRSRSLPTPQSPRAYDPKYPRRRTSGRAAATSAAQRRTALSTWLRFGQTSTDEFNDLTGIADGLIALDRTVMFEGRAFGVPVGISRRHVKIVEHLGFFSEVVWRYRQLGDQPRDDMTPRLLSQREMKRFERHLGRLLCGET